MLKAIEYKFNGATNDIASYDPDALIPIQASLQAVSNEILLEPLDEVIVTTSDPDVLDCFLSYQEIIIHPGYL